MKANRQAAIAEAARAQRFGIILGRKLTILCAVTMDAIHPLTPFSGSQGTLGRQGSPAVLTTLTEMVENAGKEYVVVLLSEIFPNKLEMFDDVDAWIQVRKCYSWTQL